LNVDGGQVQSIQAATQDAMRILGRAGGTSSYVGTLTPAALTASRTWTFPDAAGTVGLLERANTWSANQTHAVADAAQQTYHSWQSPTLDTMLFRYVRDAIGDIPANVWNFRSGGSASRNLAFSSTDGSVKFFLPLASGGDGGLAYFRSSLAIGATALVGSERLLVSGGSASTPGATQVTMGGGQGIAGDGFRSQKTSKIGGTLDYATTGTTHNLAASDVAVIRYTGAGTAEWTGVTGGYDGRILVIVNGTANDLTLVNGSGSSTDINRFSLAGAASVVLGNQGGATFVYVASRWRMVGHTN